MFDAAEDCHKKEKVKQINILELNFLLYIVVNLVFFFKKPFT